MLTFDSMPFSSSNFPKTCVIFCCWKPGAKLFSGESVFALKKKEKQTNRRSSKTTATAAGVTAAAAAAATTKRIRKEKKPIRAGERGVWNYFQWFDHSTVSNFFL